MDATLAMLDELRTQGRAIPLWDADARELWFDAIAQVALSLHNQEQAWAWLVLIANDTCMRMPGLSLDAAMMPLLTRCQPTWRTR